jgi:hypothetical protein
MYASMREMAGKTSRCKGHNYHFLGRSLGQGVAIAQIIDFNVFNVITVRDVNLGVQFG